MNYFIVFNDRSVKEITEQQKMSIFEGSANPNFKNILIGDSLIAFSSIAKILSEKEYCEQYPDKRVAEVPLFKSLPEPILSEDQNKTSQVKRLKLMIQGLQNYINSDNYQGTDKPKILLAQIKQKLEKATQGINFEIRDFYNVIN